MIDKNKLIEYLLLSGFIIIDKNIYYVQINNLNDHNKSVFLSILKLIEEIDFDVDGRLCDEVLFEINDDSFIIYFKYLNSYVDGIGNTYKDNKSDWFSILKSCIDSEFRDRKLNIILNG